MSSTKKLTAGTSVRRLEPQAKLPSAEGLSGLSPTDVEDLKRRLAEPVECVFDSAFQRGEAEDTFMGPLPEPFGDYVVIRHAEGLFEKGPLKGYAELLAEHSPSSEMGFRRIDQYTIHIEDGTVRVSFHFVSNSVAVHPFATRVEMERNEGI